MFLFGLVSLFDLVFTIYFFTSGVWLKGKGIYRRRNEVSVPSLAGDTARDRSSLHRLSAPVVHAGLGVSPPFAVYGVCDGRAVKATTRHSECCLDAPLCAAHFPATQRVGDVEHPAKLVLQR